MESVSARYIKVPGGPDGYVPVTRIVPDPVGFLSQSDTYGDFVNDPVAAAAWRGPAGEALRGEVPAPTPGADIQRHRYPASGDGTEGALGTTVVGPCDDSTYTLFAGSWTSRQYGYSTRNSSFPAGNTTREEITKGHHAWNYTENNCGFNDITNLTAGWAGTTSETFHTYHDGISVIDFGSMSSIGKSDSTTVATASVWWDSNLNNLSTDQRYNELKTWVHAGQSSGYDVWNTATHETGHSIGLDGDFQSSSDTELTMYCCVSYGETKKRTLARGDILGMRAKYP